MPDFLHSLYHNKAARPFFAIIFLLSFFSSAFGGTEVSPRKESYSQGESVTITPQKNEANGTKYQLWSIFNQGQWEIAIDKFSGPVNFQFKNNGLYALQINTLNADGQILAQNWLGQFYVGPANSKYIKGISWRPYKVTYKKGEALDFLVEGLKSKPLDSLEFQLLIAKNGKEWTEVIPWHKWPLPKFINKESVPYALGLNVREKNSFLRPQKIFIGNFLPENVNFTRDNFLSAIIAHHRALETSYDSLEKSVATELNLSIHLLYWSHLPLSVKIARAKLLNLGVLKGSSLYLKTKDGVNLVADLKNNSVTDGLLSIQLALSSHPYLNNIFTLVNKLPEEVQISAVAMHFLYSHYLYSQVPDRTHRPFLGLKDDKSMCNLNAIMLQHIIANFGYNIRAISFASYDRSKGQNQLISSHAINEIFVNGLYYVLDATTNRIGKATSKSIVETKKIPEFIILPQAFDAASLYKYSISDIGLIPQVSLDRV